MNIVSLESQSNIEILRKQNSLFPSGPVIRRLLRTVAVESPESSVATFKPFERVVTLVSGTLYNDCNNRKKSDILNGKKK